MINQNTLKNGLTESNAGIGAHNDERSKLVRVQLEIAVLLLWITVQYIPSRKTVNFLMLSLDSWKGR
jgi:hypothetical protein